MKDSQLTALIAKTQATVEKQACANDVADCYSCEHLSGDKLYLEGDHDRVWHHICDLSGEVLTNYRDTNPQRKLQYPCQSYKCCCSGCQTREREELKNAI